MQSSLAQSEPVTPGEPKLSGCVAASAPLPAWVSTKGMLWRSAKAASTSSASEYSTPPPEMIIGREAFASMAATSATSRGSGSGRRMRHVAGLEEIRRIVVALRLDVLAEGEDDRPGVLRIRHHAEGAGERGQKVLGPGDPVEVASDRSEAVIGGDRAVVEVLDLLQDRIGAAIGEDVARDQQDRQAVHVRERRSGDHVRRARPDGRGDGHRPLAPLRLGIGDRGMGHGLLVLAAPGRQGVADAVQRLADACDVAVAEDRPNAFDEPFALLGHLDREPPHHGLRGRETDRLAHAASSVAPLRASSQMRQSRAKLCAIVVDGRCVVESRPASQSRAAWPKIVRPTAKPFTSGNLAASAKEAASSSSGASSPSTTMPRVRGSFRSIACDGVPPFRFGLEGLELPPVGVDPEIVEALDDPCGRVRLDGADLRGDDLQEQFQTVSPCCVEQAQHRRLLIRPHRIVVVGMTEAEHLDDLVAGPFREAAIVRPKAGSSVSGREPGHSTGRPIQRPCPSAA